jgi:hypothetical protein
MKVSLKKAFSILDGRLSTEIGDVYEMLNYIFDADFFTHQLPTAIKTLKEKNPEWFQNGIHAINAIKESHETNDFAELMKIFDEYYPTWEIELGKIDVKIEFMAGLEHFLD